MRKVDLPRMRSSGIRAIPSRILSEVSMIARAAFRYPSSPMQTMPPTSPRSTLPNGSPVRWRDIGPARPSSWVKYM